MCCDIFAEERKDYVHTYRAQQSFLRNDTVAGATLPQSLKRLLSITKASIKLVFKYVTVSLKKKRKTQVARRWLEK